MPREKNPIPSYRRHAKTGRACVSVYKHDGSRTEIVLPGEYGSEESKAEYARLIAQLQTNNGKLAPPKDSIADITVAELVERFLRDHVEPHYRHADGSPTAERRDYILTIRPLVRLFGSKLACEVNPLDLRAYRDAIVSGSWMTPDEKAEVKKIRGGDGTVCRKTSNQRVGRIKRLFKWAVEMMLVPSSVWHGLQAVAGLQAGRGKARESIPVEPVPIDIVEATLPFCPEVVADMIRVQLHCGARAGEVVKLRTCDIDQTALEGVWVFAPPTHKNFWRGHKRKIAMGPRCQLILRRYIRPAAPEAYLFNPAVGMKRSRGGRIDDKVTHRPHYTVDVYDKAIARACKLAKVAHWSSHQLRHLAAQLAEQEISLEGARAYLGHKTPSLTAHYANLDIKAAAEVAKKIG